MGRLETTRDAWRFWRALGFWGTVYKWAPSSVRSRVPFIARRFIARRAGYLK